MTWKTAATRPTGSSDIVIKEITGELYQYNAVGEPKDWSKGVNPEIFRINCSGEREDLWCYKHELKGEQP